MDTTAKEEFMGVVAKLHAAQHFQATYPAGHPRAELAFDECLAALQGLLEREPKLQFAVADGELVFGRRQLPSKSALLQSFMETLQGVGIERVEILQGIERQELQAFLDVLGEKATELERLGGVERALADAGVAHILAGRIRTGGGSTGDSPPGAWEAYSAGLAIVRSLRQEARELGSLTPGDTLEFATDVVGLAMADRRPLLAIHALKTHDEYSYTHSINVTMLTVAMASCLPFDRDQLHEIAVAALLHDVGKERVPLEILNKPGKLTPQEWEVMGAHGVEGAAMLAETPGIGELPLIVAYEHHLSHHGNVNEHDSWRPQLVSQVVALADVYDALRSVRPYRGEMSPDKALEIMEEDVGKKFDPDLFLGFSRMLGYYPPGTCVRLASGAVGVVYSANPQHLRRPRVRLVRDAAGDVIQPPESLDLADPRNASDERVVEVVDGEALGIEPLSHL